MNCPYCGKFVSKVTAISNGLDEIVKVAGVCKTHGEVDVMDSDWCYEDFFPEGG